MLDMAVNIQNDSLELVANGTSKTRVLIVMDHPGESRDVVMNLRRLELDVQLCLFDGQILSSIPNRAPDAVLCHLIEYPQHGPKLARVIRSHYKNYPVPIVGAMSTPAAGASEGFDSMLFAPMHASQIANRVNAMIRLGVMEAEISRRQETLREVFGETLELGDLSVNRKFRVLFIGKATPSFMVIVNALQDKGVEVTAAFTSFSAFDYLHGDPFDAVVMNALEQTEPAFSISEAMRRNSKLYHTPTLFLVNGDMFKDHEAAYKHGVRDIIDQKAPSEEISGRIIELANYHRVHEQLKADYSMLSLAVAGDKTGTAYSEKFLRAHLPRLFRDAEKLKTSVSLIGIKLVPSCKGDVSNEAITSAYCQIANLLTGLVRMQDVVCRIEQNKFIIAFFDTEASAAETIGQRIRSLLDSNIYDAGMKSVKLGGLSVSAETTIRVLDSFTNIQNNPLDDLISSL
jgi:two-component system cell cycle response regulator PopA